MKKTLYKILSLALTVGLLASLIVAVVPAGALAVISVAAAPNTISAVSIYTITFTGSLNLPAGGTVILNFPVGTNLAGATVTSFDPDGAGIAPAAPAATTDYTAAAAGIISFTTAAAATVGDPWVVVVGGIVNPGTAGNYQIAVSTSAEPTPVMSANYAIGAPNIVQLYNGSGAYLGTWSAFGNGAGSIGAALIPFATIKASPGVFVTPAGFTIGVNNVTLTSAGGPAPVIYVGALTVTGNFCTVSNMIINSFGAGTTTTFGGTNATVTGCTFGKTSSPTYPYSVPDLLVVVNGANFKMTNTTVNTATAAGFADVGVQVNANDARISGCTFKADQTVGFAPDSALLVGPAAVTGLKIENNTFTGNGGIGYDDLGAFGTTATLTANKFDKFETAISVTNTAFLSANEVTNSITNNPTAPKGAIEVSGLGYVTVAGGKVANNTGFSFNFTGGGNGQVAGVNFSSNTKGFNNATFVPVNAKLNYWGAANGPLDLILNPTGSGDPVSVDVDYRPFLSSLSQASATGIATGFPIADNFDASMLPAGVYVGNYTGTAFDVVIMQKLASNPRTIDPGLEAVQYFDVYTQSASTTAMVLKLYAFGLTADCQAYYWSAVSNTWKLCSSQGVAGTGDYIYININPAGAIVPTTPNSLELVGTPFVIVKGFVAPAPSFAINAPLQGAATGLSNVGFTWAPVAGANAYQIVISTNADMSSPIVVEMTAGTAYTLAGPLTAGPYYWYVNAFQNDTLIGLSQVGTFTAQAPPTTASPTPPVIFTTVTTIVPTPTVTSTVITVPPAEPAPQITPAWIWGIIGIGAVLVIVVIVLIVRTRRTS